MARIARSCLQSMLKLVNSGLGMVGIALTIYSLWMLRAWLGDEESSEAPVPWFIYTVLGLGITLCLITCSGHIAAETANGCCLYIYMAFVFFLFMLEAAVTADVFLNHSWEEDFPEDSTGNFDKLKSFIKENFDICKWIGLAVVALQGISLLLAMVLKALGPHPERYYESDDDYLPDRVPLLKDYVPPPAYVVTEPSYGMRNDAWNVRINSKGDSFTVLSGISGIYVYTYFMGGVSDEKTNKRQAGKQVAILNGNQVHADKWCKDVIPSWISTMRVQGLWKDHFILQLVDLLLKSMFIYFKLESMVDKNIRLLNIVENVEVVIFVQLQTMRDLNESFGTDDVLLLMVCCVRRWLCVCYLLTKVEIVGGVMIHV